MRNVRLTNSSSGRLICGLGVVFLGSIFWRLPLTSGQSLVENTRPVPTAPTPEKVFRRFDLFQMLLEERGLAPVRKLTDVLADPADSTIVIAGNPATVPHLWSEFPAFVQGGGSLLVLDEYAWNITGFGRFRAGPVSATKTSDCYQGHFDCVLVRDIVDPNSILRGVSTLVTNRSNWFEPAAESWISWQSMARFPAECKPADSQGRDLLAIGRAPGGGTGLVLVAADASLLTNGMLWHGDNALLAIRIADILHGNVSRGNSKGLLYFVDNGQVLGSYREQLAMPPVSAPPPAIGQEARSPDVRTLLSFANAITKDAINSGMLNETLRQRPRHWTASDYFQWLVSSLTLVFLVAALWKLAAYRPKKRTFPVFRRMITGYEMRNLMGGHTDFHNPAAHLAREFCLELTGTRLSAEWQKYLGKLTSMTDKLSRSEQQSLTRIFDIASRGCREKMSSSEFQQLGKTIANLRQNQLESLRMAMSDKSACSKAT